jgi:hypothetical protein
MGVMRYRDLRDKPIHLMSDEEFEYIVDQLLNAKVITNED